MTQNVKYWGPTILSSRRENVLLKHKNKLVYGADKIIFFISDYIYELNVVTEKLNKGLRSFSSRLCYPRPEGISS